MKDELTEMKEKIKKILKTYGIVRAGIFGSYARGEQNKKSDVDIVIEKPKNRKFSLFDLVGLEFELEDEIGRKIDILTYKSIHRLLRERILREEIKII